MSSSHSFQCAGLTSIQELACMKGLACRQMLACNGQDYSGCLGK